MPHELWKGGISFGLVHIPVGLYSAEKQNELNFTLLDRRNMAPVGYQRFNKETGEDVPWEEVVKGYEYEEGRYVVLSDEDFRRANIEAIKTVDILNFVEARQISLVYYDRPYYLVPGKGSEKGYVLLREALKRARKVALITFVMHTKQYLAALIPKEKMLVLNVLRYSDEIRSIEEFDLPSEDLDEVGVSEKEIDMAIRLVEGMSEEWNPNKYHDAYREDILTVVEEKIKTGQTQVITPPSTEEETPAAGVEIYDLMVLLKRSIEANLRERRRASGTIAHQISEPPAAISRSERKITPQSNRTPPTHKEPSPTKGPIPRRART